MNLEHIIKELVANMVDIDEDDFTINTPFNEISDWDSVNTMRLIGAIEKDTNIKIPVKEYIKQKTIAEVARLLENKEMA